MGYGQIFRLSLEDHTFVFDHLVSSITTEQVGHLTCPLAQIFYPTTTLIN